MGRGWVEAGDTRGAALGSFGNAVYRGAEMEKSRSQRWPHVSPVPRLPASPASCHGPNPGRGN